MRQYTVTLQYDVDEEQIKIAMQATVESPREAAEIMAEWASYMSPGWYIVIRPKT